jgi:tRNA (adenine57-N1/adenine58-N1)-methyltransferase
MPSPFHQRRKLIEDGDLIVLYQSPKDMRILRVQANQTFECTAGIFHHFDFIGKPYGSQIKTHNGKGHAYLLHLTPELWTTLLPHRTQIVYTTDMAVVSAELGLIPGSRVIESGTGSGSMTHHLSRIVGESGRVFTFEYHELRAQKAREEFLLHQLSNVVAQHQDVCAVGFETEEFPLRGTIDAVFLDLPEPWKAVPHVVTLFKQDGSEGRICCFSPCIEQVQKTCTQLIEYGFNNIKMVECLEQKMESRLCAQQDFFTGETKEVSTTKSPFPTTKGHTAFLTFASFTREFENEVPEQ